MAAAGPAMAQSSRAPRSPRAAHTAPTPPRPIGKFDDWTAATHQEAGQTVCYALTRAVSSTPAVPGRGDVVLTVTQRPAGPRDVVAFSVGFPYAANAEVVVTVDGAALAFYTNQRYAFARDGHTVVGAFERGRQAVIRSPAPHNSVVTDTFNLRGFSPAFAAINKACPGKG
jgi:hypothetical protein